MAPFSFLQHLKGYYTKDEEPPPVLPTKIAAALSVLYTIIYVLPFYLSPLTRPSPTLSRDAPSVIRARVRFVTVSVIISTIITLRVINDYAPIPRADLPRLLGWYPISPQDIVKPLFLTAILFTGPLFEKTIVESGWREWIRGKPLYDSLSTWFGWRNYVAGPITEELLFRSLIIPLHLLTPLSPSRTILITPLYFGIAHVHHFYEFTLTHPRTPLLPALLRSLFQFAFTIVFGWYASFVFVRTGSIWGVVLTHSFCNWCGLPRVWGRLKVGAEEIIGTQVGGKESRRQGEWDGGGDKGKRREAVMIGDGRLGVAWTVVYYVLLVAGAVGFWKGLWPLTESVGKLAEL